MIHTDELQDALNRSPLTRCTAWQESLPTTFSGKHPANLNHKMRFDQQHPMNELTAAPSRLKSRKSFFLRIVPPFEKDTMRQLKTHNVWQNYSDNIPDQHKLQNIPVQESLPPPGYKLQRNKWRCPNHLKSGVGKTKTLLLKWGCLPLGTGTTCHCGKENQTMNHLLTCEKPRTTCTMDDLLQRSSNARKITTARCNTI